MGCRVKRFLQQRVPARLWPHGRMTGFGKSIFLYDLYAGKFEQNCACNRCVGPCCSQTVVANSNERRVEIKTNCQKKQSKKTDDISKVSNGNRRKRFKNAVPVYHTHGVKMSGRVLPELGRSQHRKHIYFPVEAGQTYLMETYVL